MNTTINEQIKILEEAYLIASKSKESATKYLEDAGIIKKQNMVVKTTKQRNRSTVKK